MTRIPPIMPGTSTQVDTVTKKSEKVVIQKIKREDLGSEQDKSAEEESSTFDDYA